MATKLEAYYDFLKREGYVPELEGSDAVRFKIQGEVYLIVASEDDPGFFKLSYFHRWSTDQNEKAWPVINALNARLKVVKISVLEEVLSISAEVFLKEQSDFEAVFPRCVNAIGVAKANLAVALSQMNAAGAVTVAAN